MDSPRKTWLQDLRIAMREHLKVILRSLAGIVKSTLKVSESQKLLLELTVPSARVTVPPPQTKPVLKVIAVDGHTVKIRLHDLEVPRRGKPRGVSGATHLSYGMTMAG